MLCKIINQSNQFKEVSLDEIKPMFSFQQKYVYNLYNTLKLSIKRNNVREPIVLIKNDNTYLCVDGFQRLCAVQELIDTHKYYYQDIPIMYFESFNDIFDKELNEYIICASLIEQKKLSALQKRFFAAKWIYPEIKKLAMENQKYIYNTIPIQCTILSNQLTRERLGFGSPEIIAKTYNLIQYIPRIYDLVMYQKYKISFTLMKILVKIAKTDTQKASNILDIMLKLSHELDNKNLNEIYLNHLDKSNISEYFDIEHTELNNQIQFVGVMLNQNFNHDTLMTIKKELQLIGYSPIFFTPHSNYCKFSFENNKIKEIR